MAKKIKRKIIVSGRPRSGTSLMMRILDVSGYNCARDLNREKHLAKTISNPYFYETKKFTKGKSINLVDYDAAKMFVDKLETILESEKYFVIWMHRNKESMFHSWNSYQRYSKVDLSNENYYNLYNEKKILEKFKHVIIDYDNLIEDPRQELKKFTKLLKINKPLAIREIDPNLRHF